ncbi:hypothetical protein OG946_08340 [Streptomyces sp. NBC_01808]|uniref:hypothetical protein n=1 Tax=Streptomyces sp. NBC_01808 TaxID=2975947 RepID=UPI002DD960D5|nr:hypothetical protein [Streptomyces sp. NBC_01808]WSA37385.1 hypothetical protein OG946_08340 [Streptomyces sp. NBC_01808]
MELYHGPCRDIMLRAAARALLPEGVEHALQTAGLITEPRVRDGAFGDIAVALADSAR